jgi:hypothetical protein
MDRGWHGTEGRDFINGKVKTENLPAHRLSLYSVLRTLYSVFRTPYFKFQQT